MQNSLLKPSAVLSVAIMTVFTLTACSGKKDYAAAQAADTTLTGVPYENSYEGREAAKAAQQAAVAAAAAAQRAAGVAALPKADPNYPLNQYITWQSGAQVMFMYNALNNAPLDYDKIASLYSSEYRNNNDTFKKSDLLKSLTPNINAEIGRAKANRYFVVTLPVQLNSYDLSSHSFTDTSIVSGTTFYFVDSEHPYNYSFTNGDSFKTINVIDETLARKIEGVRSNGSGMSLRIYAYAQGDDTTNINLQTVQSQIVKAQLLDENGGVLFTQ